MNIGDIQTFYPAQAGGLESSSFLGFRKEESRATGDDIDDSQDDQESVEFEDTDATEAGGISEAEMPTFRQLVRAKKLELKAQYGKGRFRIGECGIKPFRENATKYNPIVRIGESRTCIGWGVSCDKKCFGVCCGPTTCNNWAVIPGNTQAYDNASEKFSQDLAAWNSCEKGWVPGWRKQWRIFKRDGGLAQLKMKAQGLLTPQEQAQLDADTKAAQQALIDAEKQATQELAKQQSAITRANILAKIKQAKNTASSKLAADEKAAKMKKMFIFGVIALVVIIAILLIIMVIKGKSKKS